jgi:chemotaxis protein MotA
LLASALTRGWADLCAAVQATAGLLGRGFDEPANRSALARVVHAVRLHGRHAAEAPLPPDPALAAVVAAYLRMSDAAAVHEVWAEARALAKRKACAGVGLWRVSADHAPVFGLVGTLFAITHLAPSLGLGMAQATASAMAGAVVSTLYGLLFAHLVCLPLAGALARRAQAEDAARARLANWFESQLPRPRPVDPGQPHTVLMEVA